VGRLVAVGVAAAAVLPLYDKSANHRTTEDFIVVGLSFVGKGQIYLVSYETGSHNKQVHHQLMFDMELVPGGNHLR
jgi:hypothetical protein